MRGPITFQRPMTVFWSRAHRQRHVTIYLMKFAVGERNVAIRYIYFALDCVIWIWLSYLIQPDERLQTKCVRSFLVTWIFYFYREVPLALKVSSYFSAKYRRKASEAWNENIVRDLCIPGWTPPLLNTWLHAPAVAVFQLGREVLSLVFIRPRTKINSVFYW